MPSCLAAEPEWPLPPNRLLRSTHLYTHIERSFSTAAKPALKAPVRGESRLKASAASSVVPASAAALSPAAVSRARAKELSWV